MSETGYDADDDCGWNYDHDFPEPEFIDGVAVLVCRRCGGEIFEDEPTTPTRMEDQR